MKFNIIVAFSKNRGIGFKNNLPWSIRSDLIKFRRFTIGEGNNAIIMGKNTWESLPHSPLSSRDNLILSKTLSIDKEIFNEKLNKNYVSKTFNSIENILDYCQDRNYDNVWIIGGSQIYNQFLETNLLTISEIYVTYIDAEFECDSFFPVLEHTKYRSVEQRYHDITQTYYDFKIYDRIYKNIEKIKKY